MILNKAFQNFSTVHSLNTARKMSKDVFSGPLVQYCIEMSTPLHPSLKSLLQENLQHPRGSMAALPQVLQINSMLIKMIKAKKVLDIGVFTGASSLAAALALPHDGSVTALDKSTKFTNIAIQHWKDAGVADKIDLIVGPAKDSLEGLVCEGGAGSYDFAFIDADKAGYTTYYYLTLDLLKQGGILVLDNTLFRGKVIDQDCDDKTVVSIKNVNQVIKNDERVISAILPIGDGYTLVIKNN